MTGQFTGMNSRKVIYSAVIKKPEGTGPAQSCVSGSPLWCDLDFCSQLSFGRVAVRTQYPLYRQSAWLHLPFLPVQGSNPPVHSPSYLPGSQLSVSLSENFTPSVARQCRLGNRRDRPVWEIEAEWSDDSLVLTVSPASLPLRRTR